MEAPASSVVGTSGRRLAFIRWIEFLFTSSALIGRLPSLGGRCVGRGLIFRVGRGAGGSGRALIFRGGRGAGGGGLLRLLFLLRLVPVLFIGDDVVFARDPKTPDIVNDSLKLPTRTSDDFRSGSGSLRLIACLCFFLSLLKILDSFCLRQNWLRYLSNLESLAT